METLCPIGHYCPSGTGFDWIQCPIGISTCCWKILNCECIKFYKTFSNNSYEIIEQPCDIKIIFKLSNK